MGGQALIRALRYSISISPSLQILFDLTVFTESSGKSRGTGAGVQPYTRAPVLTTRLTYNYNEMIRKIET